MISVIIPAYNAESTLGETLFALQHQSLSRSSYEIIVVDDGSDDHTARIARASADRAITQEHAGPAAARNKGAEMAKGDILVFTDSDCVPFPDWLEKLCASFSNHEVVAIKGAYHTRQRSLVARFAQVEFEERYTKLSKYHRIDFVDSYSAAIRRSAFLEVGGFDVRFPKANNEDVDLSYKLAARGSLMQFAPTAKVSHRHPDSLKRYLRTKFFRAYWRAMVYRRHPAKLFADSYTPQLLKLQIVLAPLLLVLLFLGLCHIIPFWTTLAMLALFAACAFPLGKAACAHDRGVLPLVLPLTFVRAFALAAGAIVGGLSHRRRDLLIPLLLLLADSLALLSSLLGAFYLRSNLLQGVFTAFAHDLSIYLRPFPIVLLLWLGSFAYLNLYAVRVHTTPFVEFLGVLKGSVLSLLVIMSLSFLAKFDYSRFLVLVFFVLVVPFTAMFRSLVRTVQKRLLREGYRTIRCLVVGTGETAQTLLNKMLLYPALGYKPIGIVSSSPPDDKKELPVPWVGKNDDVPSVANRYGIDEVFLADPSLSPIETMALALACDSVGASCKVLSGFSPIIAGRDGAASLSNLPMVDLSRARFGPLQVLTKRIMDLVLSSLTLLVMGPLFMVLLLLQWARRIRPLLTIEERVGRSGHLFRTSKLTTSSKPSVIDRLIQRSGMDSLPRLLVVARGEMSLVGPRGEPPQDVAENPPWERLFLEVKPGLTGLWLVGRTGEIPGATDEEYDFYYLRNRSLLLDLVLLLRTLPALWRTGRRP